MPLSLDHALDWATGHKHGVLVTLRRDGRPQTSDIVYAVIDGAIVVSLTATRAKTANMRRDPRVVLHVTSPDTWSYVSFDGTAELGPVTMAPDDDAADDLVTVYRAIAGSEHSDWDEFRTAMVAEQRQVLRVRPATAVGQING